MDRDTVSHVRNGGASIFKMMDVSRHRSVAELFKDHAGAGLL
jgi:hypothetical protein